MGVAPLFVGKQPTVSTKNRRSDREVTGVTGQYEHNIDAKGRLFIPAKLRAELGMTFHVMVGQDHCLSIYSDESWKDIMERLRSLSYSEVKKLRTAFANAADCEPDAQGRILIPAKLRQYAGLEKEVVINGSFGRAEIWNAERWHAMERADFDSGELEAAMESMGL